LTRVADVGFGVVDFAFVVRVCFLIVFGIAALFG
jgi:hypothetical protein